MIDAMDVYARLRAEADSDGEHSLRLAITALDIEIKTSAGTVTLGHGDFDQVARLVGRCRAAWSRLARETGDGDMEDEDTEDRETIEGRTVGDAPDFGLGRSEETGDE